jgi:CRP-like cAMP-binding protein
VLIEPKPRNVTAVALTDRTEVLGLSNDAYNRTIEKAVKRDIIKRIKFLSSFRILKNMSQYQIERMLIFFKPIECNRGKVLYKIGDKPEGVYFIQEGNFEVTLPSKINDKAE